MSQDQDGKYGYLDELPPNDISISPDEQQRQWEEQDISFCHHRFAYSGIGCMVCVECQLHISMEEYEKNFEPFEKE